MSSKTDVAEQSAATDGCTPFPWHTGEADDGYFVASGNPETFGVTVAGQIRNSNDAAAIAAMHMLLGIAATLRRMTWCGGRDLQEDDCDTLRDAMDLAMRVYREYGV